MGLLNRIQTKKDEKDKNPTLSFKLCVITNKEIVWNFLGRKGERRSREEEKENLVDKTILGTFQRCHEANYILFY